MVSLSQPERRREEQRAHVEHRRDDADHAHRAVRLLLQEERQVRDDGAEARPDHELGRADHAELHPARARRARRRRGSVCRCGRSWRPSVVRGFDDGSAPVGRPTDPVARLSPAGADGAVGRVADAAAGSGVADLARRTGRRARARPRCTPATMKRTRTSTTPASAPPTSTDSAYVPCVSVKRVPNTRPRSRSGHDLLQVGVHGDEHDRVGDAEDGEAGRAPPTRLGGRDQRRGRRP